MIFGMAGYPIAMENAAPILKETDDFVPGNHTENGVAEGLWHLL
ncbi:HAD hydrolase family protein [Paenibacillus sp. 22594]